MRKPLSSIGGVMSLILLVGMGLAAMTNPSKSWASILFTATVGSLLASMLGAILRRGAPRAFWIGFSVFGWGYLLMHFFFCRNPIDLPTPAGDLAVESFYNILHNITNIRTKDGYIISMFNIRRDVGDSIAFFQISHSLLCLAAAGVGGCIALAFHSTNEEGT